jgi:hypothetical protein
MYKNENRCGESISKNESCANNDTQNDDTQSVYKNDLVSFSVKLLIGFTCILHFTVISILCWMILSFHFEIEIVIIAFVSIVLCAISIWHICLKPLFITSKKNK